jgi:ParB-like chromosome segregation protein Spo0J
VQETSFEHPVIMDPSGFIVDGWHRVTKALLEGRDTIPAVRFKEMPAWEYTDK